jgi:hypothetical protein
VASALLVEMFKRIWGRGLHAERDADNHGAIELFEREGSRFNIVVPRTRPAHDDS